MYQDRQKELPKEPVVRVHARDFSARDMPTHDVPSPGLSHDQEFATAIFTLFAMPLVVGVACTGFLLPSSAVAVENRRGS